MKSNCVCKADPDLIYKESNSAHEREVPTSYTIKANFKPSEVRTHSIDNVKREDINRTRKKKGTLYFVHAHNVITLVTRISWSTGKKYMIHLVNMKV